MNYFRKVVFILTTVMVRSVQLKEFANLYEVFGYEEECYHVSYVVFINEEPHKVDTSFSFRSLQNFLTLHPHTSAVILTTTIH